MSARRLGCIEYVSDQEIRTHICLKAGTTEASEADSTPGQVGTYVVIPQPE